MAIIDVPPMNYGHPLRPLCYALKPPATPNGYSNAHCTIQEGHPGGHIWERGVPVAALRALLTCWDKDSDTNWHALAALCVAAEGKP
jgi:hypothetical protein